ISTVFETTIESKCRANPAKRLPRGLICPASQGACNMAKSTRNTANGGRMFKTRNDLPVKTRQTSIALLNQALADLTDLFSQTKQAHWNVKGLEFFQLHELFDEMAAEVLAHTDE